MTDIRISVANTSETGGTFLTPVYFGFHDGSFDLFNAGEAASAGLEELAEDGGTAGLAAERVAADADSQGIVVTGAAGPVATQETASATLSVDGVSNGSVSLAAMILPSNDAFIGTDDAIQLFDEDGNFLGAQTIVFEGDDVYDAGTEVNTELDAAFLNQTAPNTGEDENGVVRQHEGFNGSQGNPVGEGDQNIIGGTNAAGADITEAADFTVEGAQIATVHINTFVMHDGTSERDVIKGASDDDLVAAGDGNDKVFTRDGWDAVDGGAGNDVIRTGKGNDTIYGGLGDDKLTGGHGDDAFIFVQGDGFDIISDFNRKGDDHLTLVTNEITTFEELMAYAVETKNGVALKFDENDTIIMRGIDLEDLSASDFSFMALDPLLG